MKHDDIHTIVSRTYAAALRRSADRVGADGPTPAATAGTSRVDYGREAERFEAAAASSFGCGNPLAFAEIRVGQTVLDLGSGAGLDLLIAADRVGPTGRVIGVDMTEEMLEAARANARRACVQHVDLRKGTIEALPVETGSVDWVISNCVINLSPNKPRVFAEIARVLRPDGRFSISDIVVQDLPAWIRDSSAAYVACIAGAISESDYVAGLRQAGLRRIEVAERLVYDSEQIRAMIDGELSCLGVDAGLVDKGLEAVAGKVWSAKFVGQR